MTDVPTLRGIDVSSFQGVGINWAAVKAAGATFAWAKCAEGVGFKDSAFGYNWPAMQQAGLIRGAYAFARPALGNAPEAEADWFLQSVGTLLPGDLVALDLEEEAPGRDLAAWGLAWLRHAERLLGWPPLLYTGLDYAQRHFAGTLEIAHYPLWLAAYGPQMPACPAPWRIYVLWQHTASAHYSAIAGVVDESLAARSTEELKALGKPPPARLPAPPADAQPAYQWATVTTAQWLRATADAGSARLVLAPVGAILPITGEPTPHWQRVRFQGWAGWILSAHCRLSVEHPSPSG